MKTWAEITKDYRATLGMTQEIMAKFLGVKLKTYQSWEYGNRVPLPIYQDGIRKKFEDKIMENSR